MLIPSNRHTPQDREAWARAERYDHALASSLGPKVKRALDTITSFREQGKCYASTSWGKDSTVLVDLIGRTGLDIPIVSLVIDGYEQPGTTQVRDMVLDRHPHLRYDELTLPPQPNRWWSSETVKRSKHDADIGWRMIAARYGPRRMTGIRAEESRIRTLVQDRWGDASKYAARPIGVWTAVDVYAYLASRELPVHPAYAMSHGGALDRRWIRVHALGGVSGADRGRSDWEEAYFGDVIADSRRRDRTLSILGRGRSGAMTVMAIAEEQDVHTPLSDMVRLLDRWARDGLVQCVSYQGHERWHRCVEWPPKPKWLLDAPEAEDLTLM